MGKDVVEFPGDAASFGRGGQFNVLGQTSGQLGGTDESKAVALCLARVM